MLITEHSIPNTRNISSNRIVIQQTAIQQTAIQQTAIQQTAIQQPIPSSRTIPHPSAQVKTTTANILKLMSKAGDRQSWLLLALILLPIIGMIRNFMTYGFER
jgi:hypothetical protein